MYHQNSSAVKKIYISGPITGNPHAATMFDAAEHFLRAKGFEPINPMKLAHNHSRTWEDYMREDIKALMDADAIYMLKNSEKSNGAMLERNLAVSLKIAVFHEEYPWCLDKYTSEEPTLMESFANVPQH